MNWSDVIKPPPDKMLRQFAVLCIVVFVGLAGWRAYHGQAGTFTWALAAFGGVVGVVGLISPPAIKPIYMGWMVAAFPIGWTISRVVLGAVYYIVFTPVASRLVAKLTATHRSTDAIRQAVLGCRESATSFHHSWRASRAREHRTA